MNAFDIAIIGAGPYGLSIAAHLRASGAEYRIIGDPMQFWLGHMPKGMLLKSDGFASTLYDPGSDFSFERYCQEQNIEYADLGVPVRIEDFCAYGRAFQQRYVPDLENKRVDSLECTSTGFALRLSDGECFTARRVIIATGLSHFEHIPSQLNPIPKDLLSHSSAHVDLDRFKGRNVTVIGAGASASELATLLYEAGSDVRIVARSQSIHIHTRMELPRPFVERVRRPISTIGPGWKSRFFTDLPIVFHGLPRPVQGHLVKGFLGPAGGWFLRGRFEQVPALAGYQLKGAEATGNRAVLWLASMEGEVRRIETEHVIAATGYRVDMNRLPFLSEPIKTQLKLLSGAPKLSSYFESSVPGLFFVGPAAVESFGPLLRFACGAKFAANHLSRHLTRTTGPTKRSGKSVGPQYANSPRL